MGFLSVSIIIILLALVGLLTAKVSHLSRENRKQRQRFTVQDQFYVLVAHEVKNPLQAQILILKNLKDSFDTLPKETVKRHITEIYRSSSSIAQLLDNIFSFRQLNTMGSFDNLTRSNLRDFVDDTFVVLKDQSTIKEVEIRNDVDPGCFVLIDRNMIATVIRNLVSNAIKFSKKGGLVTVDSRDTGDGSVKIMVSDRGIGIPPENIPRLCSVKEPYTTKGTAGETGCGLGLVASKRIVEAYGGTVDIISKVGEGSTFSFTVKKDS
jgi:signal transduction histidine kinase